MLNSTPASVNSNEDFPVQLRDLVKPLGYNRHDRLMSRYVSYCKISNVSHCHCKNTYFDVNGVENKEVNKAIEINKAALTNSRPKNIKKRSHQLMHWVSLGWLTVEYKWVKEYRYKLTPKGENFLKKVKTTFYLKD